MLKELIEDRQLRWPEVGKAARHEVGRDLGMFFNSRAVEPPGQREALIQGERGESVLEPVNDLPEF
jgi:hypothetical protein